VLPLKVPATGATIPPPKEGDSLPKEITSPPPDKLNDKTTNAIKGDIPPLGNDQEAHNNNNDT